MSSIYFFRPYDRELGYLSNFFIIEFKDNNGLEFICSEQYFMYQKCMLFDAKNTELISKIMWEVVPFKIKKFGKQVRNFDESVWEKTRYDIMLDGLRYKFGQNEDFKKLKPLSTRNRSRIPIRENIEAVKRMRLSHGFYKCDGQSGYGYRFDIFL